eukprot:3681836-Amphidinium_carterae.1
MDNSQIKEKVSGNNKQPKERERVMANQSSVGLAENVVIRAISAGGMDQSINSTQQTQVSRQNHLNQINKHPPQVNHNHHRTKCQESGHLVLSSQRSSARSRTSSRESLMIMHVNSSQRTTSNDKQSNGRSCTTVEQQYQWLHPASHLMSTYYHSM